MALDLDFLEGIPDTGGGFIAPPAAQDVQWIMVGHYLLDSGDDGKYQTKVFASKPEWEYCAKIVEEQLHFLRGQVAQRISVPVETWQRLRRLEARVVELWQITRWMWSQAKDKPSKRGKYANMGDENTWAAVPETAAKTLLHSGKMIRTRGEGEARVWEVAE